MFLFMLKYVSIKKHEIFNKKHYILIVDDVKKSIYCR